MRFWIALIVLASCLPVVAQSPVVLPDASYATSLGTTNNAIPLSWTPTRYQQVFDGTDVGTPNLFRFMQLRPASGFGGPTRGGQMVNLEIRLGLTQVNWNTATNDFAINNPNPTVVLPPTWVQMPILRAESPADWQITIPFAQIWPWPAGGNNFCVEIVNWGNTNNNGTFSYPLDATNDPALGRSCRMYASGNPTATTGTGPASPYGLIMRFGMALTNNEGFFANYGIGCQSSAGDMIHGMKEVPRINTTINPMVYGAPANAGALFILGSSRGMWGPLPLPFDLSPGAPGCWINSDMVLSAFATVAGNGQATAPFPIPNDNLLLGVELFSQWLVVDPRANTLGLATTTGARWVFGL